VTYSNTSLNLKLLELTIQSVAGGLYKFTMAENYQPAQAPRATTKVTALLAPTPENPQPQQKKYDDVLIDSDGTIQVYSSRSPEEVFLFGLTLDETSDFVRGTTVRPVSPADRGIEKARDDGLCIYCQLLLLPDPPKHTRHFPSLQLLVDSSETCQLCKLISLSLAMGSPELKQRYNDGDPSLYDRGNMSTGMTIINTKFDRHSRIVADCGNPEVSKFKGRPLVWSTSRRLGESYLRRSLEVVTSEKSENYIY
jgi:hypothetical protein